MSDNSGHAHIEQASQLIVWLQKSQWTRDWSMLGPRIESNVGFDHRVCRVEIVNSNVKTDLVALDTDYRFVAK